MSISPHAIIHPNATLGKRVHIEPFATIHADVHIGDDCWVGSHAIVYDGSRIGHHVRIFPGAIIGSDPQDLKYIGEQTYLYIDDYATIREYCTINRGTMATGSTRIRAHALIMAYVHVAHDCIIDEYAVVANSVNLAGHVSIGRYAIVGGMTAVHQFVRIGDHSFIGGGTLVRKDVPPYIKVAREPLAYTGVNSIGLKRRGFKSEVINHIQEIYRVMFIRHNNISIAMETLRDRFGTDEYLEEVLVFVSQSERGIVKGFRQIRQDDY